MKGKCRMPPVLAGHNTFIAWAPSSGKSFLIKQIYECTTKMVYVRGMTVDSMLIPSYPTDVLFFKTFATLKGSHWSAMLQPCVRTSWSPHFHFRSHLHIIFPFPPTGRDMRRKKWEVSSLVTLLFSVSDRILREICESKTSVIGSRPRTSTLAGVTYLRYTVLTSSNKNETAVHCCDPASSVLVMLVSRNVFRVVSACTRFSLYTFLAGVTYLRYTVLTSSNKSETAVHCCTLLYRFLTCWCLETFST